MNLSYLKYLNSYFKEIGDKYKTLSGNTDVSSLDLQRNVAINAAHSTKYAFHLTRILRCDFFREKLLVSYIRERGIFQGATAFLKLLIKSGVKADHILELQMAIRTLQFLESHGLQLDGNVVPKQVLALTLLLNSPTNGEFICNADNQAKANVVKSIVAGHEADFSTSLRAKMISVLRELQEIAEQPSFQEALDFTTTMSRPNQTYVLSG
ncbi:hypothetical protein TrRE_jg6332, partial [Triparma retinervis]